VVSVAVPAAIGGDGVGEGGDIVAHVAGRPERTQVDERRVSRDVKAREPDRVRARVDHPSVLRDRHWH
jgi:hypothetical protein